MVTTLSMSSWAWGKPDCDQEQCEAISRETCKKWHPQFEQKMAECDRTIRAKTTRNVVLTKQLHDCQDTLSANRGKDRQTLSEAQNELYICKTERRSCQSGLTAQRELVDKCYANRNKGSNCVHSASVECELTIEKNPRFVAEVYNYVMRQYVPGSRGCNRNRHLSAIFRQFLFPENAKETSIFLASLQRADDPEEFYNFYTAVQLIKNELDRMEELDFFDAFAPEVVTVPPTTERPVFSRKPMRGESHFGKTTATATTIETTYPTTTTEATTTSTTEKPITYEFLGSSEEAAFEALSSEVLCITGYSIYHLLLAFAIWPIMGGLYTIFANCVCTGEQKWWQGFKWNFKSKSTTHIHFKAPYF